MLICCSINAPSFIFIRMYVLYLMPVEVVSMAIINFELLSGEPLSVTSNVFGGFFSKKSRITISAWLRLYIAGRLLMVIFTYESKYLTISVTCAFSTAFTISSIGERLDCAHVVSTPSKQTNNKIYLMYFFIPIGIKFKYQKIIPQKPSQKYGFVKVISKTNKEILIK